MAMQLDIPPELEAALQAQAQANGLSPARYLQRMLERDLKRAPAPRSRRSLYGLLERYGPGPSAEEIDANRADMLQNFPRQDL